MPDGLPGAYRAWLLGRDRLAQHPLRAIAGTYTLRDGTVIAANWADLTDGALLAPLEITEQHNAVVGGRTWTNTEVDGTPLLSNQKHCNNWTDDTDLFLGHFGRAFDSTTDWTDSRNAAPCQAGAHLYCFQQS